MQEWQPPSQVRGAGGDPSGVAYFAAQVVSLLADRTSNSVAEPREELVSRLVSASLSGTRAAFADLLTEMKRSRISMSALADVYIPIAARQMGEAWHDDRMSWIDVTIGVARLQSMLREIGIAWSADQSEEVGQSTVMMIVPEQEQHTLGPMVATSQLRRYGVSVCLRIAPSFNELRTLLAARQFDGVLISTATKEKLESVAKTVQFLRTASSGPLPIVVGGAIMSKVEDPASCTGADFSSADVGKALEAMGLKSEVLYMRKRA